MRKIILILCLILSSQQLCLAEANLVSHTNEEHYSIQLDNELTIIYKDKDGREVYNKIPVLPNGKATLPRIGETEVAGLTHGELVNKIKAQLNKDTQVDVIIYRVSNNVTVIGAVKKPGSYEIKDIKTLYDAIGKAGGFSISANKEKVKLIRQRVDGSREETYINFPQEVFTAYKPGEGIGQESYLLKEGDLIWVPHSKLKQAGLFTLKLLNVATIGVISGVVSAAID